MPASFSVSLVWLGGTLDSQGRIKGSSKISIDFHNSATMACRAFKFGFYTQYTNRLIVWKFGTDWIAGADLRGVFN